MCSRWRRTSLLGGLLLGLLSSVAAGHGGMADEDSTGGCSAGAQDFDDGLTGGWELDESWRLEKSAEGGMHAAGQGAGRMTLVGRELGEGILEVRLKLVQGPAYIHFQISGRRRHLLALRADQVQLLDQLDWGSLRARPPVPISLPPDRWVTLRLTARHEMIQVHWFGQLLFAMSVPSEEWVRTGRLAFETVEGSTLLIDALRLSSGCAFPPERDRCSETDRGRVADAPGTLFTRDGVASDSCADEATLVEHWCDRQGFAHQERIACAEGCVDGACFVRRPALLSGRQVPYCGDGTCAPWESAERCAVDCPAVVAPGCAGCFIQHACKPVGTRFLDRFCAAPGAMQYLRRQGPCSRSEQCWSAECSEGSCKPAFPPPPAVMGLTGRFACPYGHLGGRPELRAKGILATDTMPGMPASMALRGAAVAMPLILGIPLALHLWRPRARRGWRWNLLSSRLVRWVVGKRWFQFALQLPFVLTFLLLVSAGLFGSQEGSRNITPVVTWTIWWAFLIFDIVLLGRLWCLVCPWDGIASWLRNLSFFGRRPWQLSLGLKWPSALTNVYPATVLFIGLCWLELGFGVTGSPRLTAVLGLVMLGLSVVPALLFEKKAYCEHGCLIGRVVGLYSTMAPVELRSADAAVCQDCKTTSCLRGNERGYPCPTGLSLRTLDRNTYCLLCTECVKSCPSGNVAIHLRPFGADLLEGKPGRRDEALMALVILSMVLFHGVVMLPTWDDILWSAHRVVGGGHHAAFSAAMAALLVGPALVHLTLTLAAWALGGRRSSVGALFIDYAFPLLPVALSYHLAHNTMHLLHEGQHVFPVLSDPFGYGWNLLGTAGKFYGPLLGMGTIWWIQLFLILAGAGFGAAAAFRVYERRRSAGKALPALLCSLLGLALFTAIALGLVHAPMVMRSAL